MKKYRFFYELTIGLFDGIAEKQLISTDDAKNMIIDIMIKKHRIQGMTMIDCNGIYTMNKTGAIISEPSIRIEIALDMQDDEKVISIIDDLKGALNQESVMYKKTVSEIDYI